MKTKLFFVGLIMLSIGVYYGYTVRNQPTWPGYHELYYTPDSYQKLVKNLSQQRQQLGSSHSSLMLVEQFKDLMPYWYGTRNAFNGHTLVPGKGSIACGYFVTTLLNDLGVLVQRISWAQLPSEKMICNLVDESSIQRFSNAPLQTVLTSIKASGQGLYLVGLDTHTGFILYDATGIRFVHSSAQAPFAVVNEAAASSFVLYQSKYRVIGKLSGDKKFMTLWHNHLHDSQSICRLSGGLTAGVGF